MAASRTIIKIDKQLAAPVCRTPNTPNRTPATLNINIAGAGTTNCATNSDAAAPDDATAVAADDVVARFNANASAAATEVDVKACAARDDLV